MSVSLNPFMEKQAVNISRDAGGVGIQLPQRFAARQQAVASPASPESDFGGDDADLKDFMRDIANPNKLKNESDTESDSGSSGVSIDYDGDGNLYDSSPESEKQQKFYEETPSTGFLSIADEKADILFRLEVLRRQGIEPRKFTARDDIREMRAELSRIKTHLELDRSLKFSRKALVGLSAAFEFLNDKVDVLDLELEGFSDQMHQSVYSQKDYDSILEELYFKYRNKIQTPPEIRLLLTFGGAALTFHMSNVMSKKIKHTIEGGDGGDMMAGIMKMFGGGGAGPQVKTPEPARPAAPAQFQQQQQDPMQQFFQQNVQQNHSVPSAPAQRKEMAPPSFAFPPLGLNNFQGMMPAQGRVSKPEPEHSFDSIRDDESERLSDIPSDLESPPPSDFGSPEQKVIELAPKKTRGRPKKNAAPARVIEI
ncbi:hypothetical protein PBCVCVM1_409L [Paramecium bursaria Chlorella virus CVM-1]|uniref:Uncharacterized protein n=1 Tax=Paramecium bursaria Chlorella virus CVA-1 TaxID=42683 RepID=M1HJY1_9PHYC|nr:hypothetical protein F8205_gp129 [Paramecium bursaria Chlorella virus CVA-1]AGE48802.1 hypothetical protein PBCVAP110A_391L [Paramecium bursaria Chlorella virus AP110A]AGE50484.1 hypothetical protein PBCVCVA1_381L [Paramecium bursaria Chlorella virus CVA-1]AGE51831.1 hypothetical protein PBCVCVM1_409L [Paramecium bursaria Chlorella virus CVM-1]AGE52164.1 hypothetical protein PBCVCVR1_389L [Paramecium bursaria Chlorella virus CVR-1]